MAGSNLMRAADPDDRASSNAGRSNQNSCLGPIAHAENKPLSTQQGPETFLLAIQARGQIFATSRRQILALGPRMMQGGREQFDARL